MKNIKNGNTYDVLTKEEFLNKLKTDKEFNMKYGRNHYEEGKMILPPCHWAFEFYTDKLSLEERRTLLSNELFSSVYTAGSPDILSHSELDNFNIPTRRLSLKYHMRSNDILLGCPFNIASYGFLLEMMAQQVNMVSGTLIGDLSNAHLYLNHIPFAMEQIKRDPMLYKAPKLKLHHAKDLFSYTLEDFEIIGYESYPNWTGENKPPLSN